GHRLPPRGAGRAARLRGRAYARTRSGPAQHSRGGHAVLAADVNSIRPAVVAIAGSEATGVAGIAVDLRVLAALGAHGAPVITANTAQQADGGALNPVSPEVLDSQLAAATQLAPAVVKTGLLADAAQIARVAEFCAQTGAWLVCDPVLR